MNITPEKLNAHGFYKSKIEALQLIRKLKEAGADEDTIMRNVFEIYGFGERMIKNLIERGY
jgi:hypothetical protein